MVDDHSRYAQILKVCTNERSDTVRTHLIDCFRRYGMPRQINTDNGNPWGNANAHGESYTKLTAWLIRLGVRVSHSRPRHPQTNGKDERFHRTLKAEVLGTRWFATFEEVQGAFDRWREVYNMERPHEGIGLDVPSSRYRASARCYPEQLPAIEYDSTDVVRSVHSKGDIRFMGQRYYVGKAFSGYPVGLRASGHDGVWDVFFCHERVATVNRRDPLATDPGEE